MKAVVRGKLIALSALIRKLERFYTSNLTAHLKALDQKKEIHPRGVDGQEIINLRAQINQMETNRTLQRINKTQSLFFEKNQQD